MYFKQYYGKKKKKNRIAKKYVYQNFSPIKLKMEHIVLYVKMIIIND